MCKSTKYYYSLSRDYECCSILNAGARTASGVGFEGEFIGLTQKCFEHCNVFGYCT